MLPWKWFKRRQPVPIQPDPAFPHILVSSVDPALVIPKRRKRSWSPWILLPVVMIPVGSFIIITRPKAIAVAITRLGATHLLAGTGLLIDSEALLPVGLIVIAMGSVLLLWLLPRWQTAKLGELSSEARFDKENESRKTLAQIIGGLFVIGSLFSTAKTLQVSQQQVATAGEQVRIAREGQITDRFTKAIEQLGAVNTDGKPKLELRLGAIYALERIALDSERDQWPIIEVLTAYVRENSPAEDSISEKISKHVSTPKAAHPRTLIKLRPDIQAILRVLGRRNVNHDPSERYMDFTKAYLCGADLREANLSNADLSGADLRQAVLNMANLRKANFSRADLEGAALQGAELSEATLQNANIRDAYLDGANLSGAFLSNADFEAAELEGANLSSSHLGANLERANLNVADFKGTDLGSAKLAGAQLLGVRNLTQSQINEAHGDPTTALPPEITRPKSWK